MESTFLCGLRHTNASEKEKFLKIAINQNFLKQGMALTALATVGNKQDLLLIFDEIFKNNSIVDSEITTTFNTIMIENPIGVDVSIDYMSKNMEVLRNE